MTRDNDDHTERQPATHGATPSMALQQQQQQPPQPQPQPQQQQTERINLSHISDTEEEEDETRISVSLASSSSSSSLPSQILRAVTASVRADSSTDRLREKLIASSIGKSEGHVCVAQRVADELFGVMSRAANGDVRFKGGLRSYTINQKGNARFNDPILVLAAAYGPNFESDSRRLASGGMLSGSSRRCRRRTAYSSSSSSPSSSVHVEEEYSYSSTDWRNECMDVPRFSTALRKGHILGSWIRNLKTSLARAEQAVFSSSARHTDNNNDNNENNDDADNNESNNNSMIECRLQVIRDNLHSIHNLETSLQRVGLYSMPLPSPSSSTPSSSTDSGVSPYNTAKSILNAQLVANLHLQNSRMLLEYEIDLLSTYGPYVIHHTPFNSWIQAANRYEETHQGKPFPLEDWPISPLHPVEWYVKELQRLEECLVQSDIRRLVQNHVDTQDVELAVKLISDILGSPNCRQGLEQFHIATKRAREMSQEQQQQEEEESALSALSAPSAPSAPSNP